MFCGLQNSHYAIQLVVKGDDCLTMNTIFNNAEIYGVTGIERELLNSILHNDIAKLKLYIYQGIDINKKFSDGTDLLYFAVINGNTDAVNILIKNGAKLDSVYQHGDKILHIASMSGFSNPDVCQILINAGCDIEEKVREGYSPLFLAIDKGNIEIAKTLIENGANCVLECFNFIVFGCYIQVERILKNKLIDVNSAINDVDCLQYVASATLLKEVPGLNGKTSDEYLKIAELLIKYGANIEGYVGEEDNYTPLIIAMSKRNFEMAKLLINNGANINAIHCDDGESPLIKASKNNNLSLVRLLLSKKANPHIRNKNKKTALDIAKENNYYEIIELLSKI